MTRQRGLWLSFGALAVLLLVGRAVAGVYADFRWYAALGATEVWGLRFWTSATLRLIAFTAGTLIAYANLWAVRHSVVSLVLPRRLANIEIGEEVPGRTLILVAAGLSVILGALFAGLASDWQTFDLAWRGTPFREADPYFNSDIGFFVYWVPFERAVFAWCIAVAGAVSIIVVVLYALTPSLRWSRGRIHVSTYVRRHLAVLSAVGIALIAWSFRLDALSALTTGSGADGGFGAFDHEFRVPIATILSYVAVGSAFVVGWAGWTGQARIAFAVMTVLFLLVPTMRYALPTLVQWAEAPLDPAVRERPYIADRNGFTRRAFGVDRIRVLPESLALASPREAALMSVWDPVPLTRALGGARRRGRVIGAPGLAPLRGGAVFVSVEAPAGEADLTGESWTVHRSLAGSTDERGQLVRVDAAGGFPLRDEAIAPVIVYEGARGDIVVPDSVAAPAAPLLRGFGARLLEAWSDRNFRLLSADARDARIVRRRDVRERVRALTPFFSQGTHVVPVAHGDSLLWAVELYSATRQYPLARRYAMIDGEVNYLRHAATALVNAHSGRVVFIPDDDPDPIARSWMRRLPQTLAKPLGLPPSLVALLPPDVDGAELQAEAFASVGVRGDAAPRRHAPSFDGSDSLVTSHAATLVWFPTMDAPAWVLPLLEPDERLSGVLIARGGVQRATYWFPFDSARISWGGLLERLRSAAMSSEYPGGEPRAAGRVRVIPLAGRRALAIQPFFAWPADAPPRIDRVAIALDDSATSARSLAAAVGAPVAVGPAPATADAREARLRELYAEMRAALRRSDWAAFGAAFEAVGALLERR